MEDWRFYSLVGLRWKTEYKSNNSQLAVLVHSDLLQGTVLVEIHPPTPPLPPVGDTLWPN